MIRVLLGAGVLMWVGATLLLSQSARLGRPSLAERLGPFHPGGRVAGPPGGAGSVYDVLLPVIGEAGDRLASLLGVSEGADVRLRRIHSSTGAASFRLRQLSLSALGFFAGALVAELAGAPVAVALLLVLGTPALAFLVIEHDLSRRSGSWQERTAEELPVVAEQMAMMLNAGLSLGSTLSRLAARSHGCAGRDLETVVNRIQQGLSESQALGEWAELVGIGSVRRLVGVLTLHSEATDLGRLVSAEARSARRDLQRRTVEQIERRAEQVWIPVTVATLVPGAILLAVPFLAALRLFSNA
jgi:tight adherence protein C